MKTFLTTAGVLCLTAGMALADPVFGIWKTTPDDNGNYGHIQIQQCGSTICGKLVKSFDKSGKTIESEHTGKKIIWNMSPKSDGKYAGGKVWAPDRDKTYNSKMHLKSASKLAISGCILGICRDGGTWVRVN